MTAPDNAPLVLVIDDNNANLQLLGEVLDRAGYRVMPALSGRQGLARAELRRPDLVLLDVAMPDLDGVECCRRLRALEGLENVPILFVTAVNDRASLVSGFAAGAVDYLTKPFVVEELLARVRTHIELKSTRDRLAAMVREREDVIDVVAHDLKNPLTCILFGAASLARLELGASAAAAAEEIGDCAEEALDYIQRFLARGAAQERLRQFAAGPVQLRDVAVEAARLLRSAADSRDVRIVVRGDATALADGRALRNVLQSLMSNAIRHSPPGGLVEVEIGAAGRDGHALCAVMDRGPGVAGEIRQRLFQRGVRNVKDESPDARYSTGLGLAIARHDVMQMGGRLWYEARPDGGSFFGFELPQRIADLAVEAR